MKRSSILFLPVLAALLFLSGCSQLFDSLIEVVYPDTSRFKNATVAVTLYFDNVNDASLAAGGPVHVALVPYAGVSGDYSGLVPSWQAHLSEDIAVQGSKGEASFSIPKGYTWRAVAWQGSADRPSASDPGIGVSWYWSGSNGSSDFLDDSAFGASPYAAGYFYSWQTFPTSIYNELFNQQAAADQIYVSANWAYDIRGLGTIPLQIDRYPASTPPAARMIRYSLYLDRDHFLSTSPSLASFTVDDAVNSQPIGSASAYDTSFTLSLGSQALYEYTLGMGLTNGATAYAPADGQTISAKVSLGYDSGSSAGASALWSFYDSSLSQSRFYLDGYYIYLTSDGTYSGTPYPSSKATVELWYCENSPVFTSTMISSWDAETDSSGYLVMFGDQYYPYLGYYGWPNAANGGRYVLRVVLDTNGDGSADSTYHNALYDTVWDMTVPAPTTEGEDVNVDESDLAPFFPSSYTGIPPGTPQ